MLGRPRSRLRTRGSALAPLAALAAVAGFGAPALLGCDRRPVGGALALERAEPTWLEPGSRLRVAGHGFGLSEPCELELRGRTFRPGLPSILVSRKLPAQALTEEELVATIDAGALSALGERGSFDGELRVRVGRGVHARSAQRAVRLDLAPQSASAARDQQRLRERAQRVLAFIGVTPAEEEPMFAGLVVAAVRDGGQAAGLGLRAGDVIERASGVSIHALEDLAPPPNPERIALRVRRAPAAQAVEIELGIAGLFEPDLSAELARLSWLVAFALCCIGACWSQPWLGRAISRLRATLGAGVGLGLGSRRGARSPAFALRLAAPALLCAGWLWWLWLIAPRASRLGLLPALAPYLGLLALATALSFMQPALGLRARFAAASATLFRMLLLGWVVASACALFGTRSLEGLVRGQGAWPWRFALLQKPALLAAFPLYVFEAGGLVPRVQPGRSGASRLLLACARALILAVLAGLASAVFAGGWQVPPELALTGRAERSLGGALFLLKAFGFAWLLDLANRTELRLTKLAVVALCVTGTALGALWLWLDPGPGIELLLGRALCTALLALAASAGLELALAQARSKRAPADG